MTDMLNVRDTFRDAKRLRPLRGSNPKRAGWLILLAVGGAGAQQTDFLTRGGEQMRAFHGFQGEFV